MADILRKFAVACVVVLLAILIFLTVANLFIPICFVDATKNNMWLLLYFAEPFLIFVSVLMETLLEKF